MAILLGAVSSGFQITPPAQGFESVNAVRLTNYTGDVLIITNINPDAPGQEYLMPFQQNVYKTENIKQPPAVIGVALGQDFSISSLLVEWSTEPLIDFPGIYPVTLTEAAIAGQAAPAFEVHTLDVLDDSTTYSIAADARRISLTMINNGPVDLRWSAFDSGWTGRPKFETILNGPGTRTVDTKQAVYFRVFTPSGGAGSLQWFMTRYGTPPIS